MREYKIKIYPFEFTNLLNCEILQEVNEHGIAKVSMYVEKHLYENYLKLSLLDTWVEIAVTTEQKKDEQTIFCGIISSFNIFVENKLFRFDMEIKTGSYLLDTKIHTRTFQNPGLTYKQVIDTCTEEYKNLLESNKSIFNMTKANEETIKKFILQYKETDWSFIRRLASHFETVIVAENKVPGTKFYFGLPKKVDVIKFEESSYSIKKDLDEYLNKIGKGLKGIFEKDFTYYIFESREIYNLGDKFSVMGNELIVSKIETYLKGSELYHNYYIKLMNGFKTPKSYSLSLLGASLEGKIIKVKSDVVQISVFEDENKAKCGVRWFPYSTVYSSPDGTGWYCMPEIGDNIRLYMPSEDEAEAYVISSTHLEVVERDMSPKLKDNRRVNPDCKSIMNKYNKEIKLCPNKIEITNNNGISIELIDDEGIKLISNKSIKITAEEEIYIGTATKDINIEGHEKITLSKGGTEVLLDDDTKIKSGQIRIN